MKAMQGWKKATAITCTAICATAAVGLTVVAFAVDLATADQIGSLVGALIGLAGFLVSLWALLRSPATAVEASDGGVAAGGSIGRIVTGDNNRLTSSAPAHHPSVSPAPSTGPVRAAGSGSTAAAGNIDEIISGDGNIT
ncbi:hypothetical protein ABZT06_45030 [Streptomyces sp. NPDC005483]|uniref:hypothetical protein n=1 Tax=Streptomyces sp. NPDC005483 TaxID=3154882 RepID=UPI0033ABFCA1